MTNREPYENEVDKISSIDGKTVFSIRFRNDGNYEFYVETLNFDDDEEIHYWSQETLPRPHIFESITETRSEIFAQFSRILTTN